MVWWTRYNAGSWVKQLRFIDNAGNPQIAAGGVGTFLTFGSTLTIGASSGLFLPATDNTILLGSPGARWTNVGSYWYDHKIGAQLTAAATITPTAAIHHVTGATTINIIATTNLPTSGNVFLTIIADSTVNF